MAEADPAGAGATGPLAGVRVIDLTAVVLGPFATQTLGDMGAEVIKVETPEGDPTRQIGPARTPGMGSYFATLNRNKRSVVLDLKRAPARAALERLIAGADVLVHNMRLGAAARLGLDYPTLGPRYPRLIHAAATGFREGSSMAEYPAFDDLIQGMSGAAALNAGADGAPRYFPTVVVDKLTGQLLASMIGMALFHRERTGRGQAVHLPMMETMLSFLLVEHLWGATIDEPRRGMGYPRMLTPHRRPYATRDGFVSVICVSDAQWARVFRAIGREELIADPRFASIASRSDHVDALYGALAEGLTTRTTAEWLAILRPLDIPCGEASGLPALLENEYLRETGFFGLAEHPVEGRVRVPAIPARFSASPPSVRRLWPRLGEHTEEVLREAGYDAAEIAAIRGKRPAGPGPEAGRAAPLPPCGGGSGWGVRAARGIVRRAPPPPALPRKGGGRRGDQRKSRVGMRSVPSSAASLPDRSTSSRTITCTTSPSRCTDPCAAIIPADRISRRWRSNRSGQTTRLAKPVSSSIVMNSTPRAEPGRWRTSTRPATVVRAPSRARARLAQGAMPSRASPGRRKPTGWPRRLRPVRR